MAASVIRAEYELLEQVSVKFATQSEELAQLRFMLRLRCDELARDGWAGESASAFFAEMEDIIFPALRRLVEAMEEAQGVTHRIVGVFESAEQNAAATYSS